MKIVRWIVFLPTSFITSWLITWLSQTVMVFMLSRGFLWKPKEPSGFLVGIAIIIAHYLGSISFIFVACWIAPSKKRAVSLIMAIILGLILVVNISGLIVTHEYQNSLYVYGTLLGGITAFRWARNKYSD